jgi:hypothetical protein
MLFQSARVHQSLMTSFIDKEDLFYLKTRESTTMKEDESMTDSLGLAVIEMTASSRTEVEPVQDDLTSLIGKARLAYTAEGTLEN